MTLSKLRFDENILSIKNLIFRKIFDFFIFGIFFYF